METLLDCLPSHRIYVTFLPWEVELMETLLGCLPSHRIYVTFLPWEVELMETIRSSEST